MRLAALVGRRRRAVWWCSDDRCSTEGARAGGIDSENGTVIVVVLVLVLVLVLVVCYLGGTLDVRIRFGLE